MKSKTNLQSINCTQKTKHIPSASGGRCLRLRLQNKNEPWIIADSNIWTINHREKHTYRNSSIRNQFLRVTNSEALTRIRSSSSHNASLAAPRCCCIKPKKKNQNNETPKISQMRIQISISKSGPGRLVREGATSFLGLKVDKAVAAPAPAPPWILAAIFFSPGRVTKRRNRRTSENSCEIDFFCKNK